VGFVIKSDGKVLSDSSLTNFNFKTAADQPNDLQ